MAAVRVAFLLRTRSLGGAELQSVRAARALIASGVEARVWTLAESWVSELARRAGVAVEALPRGPVEPGRLREIDVLHVHEPRDLPWAVLAARVRRVPVVSTRHLAASPRRRGDPYHAWLARRTRFVAASRFVRASLVAAYGVPAERIAVVPYGTAVSARRRDAGRAGEERLTVGMLSRLSHGKHLDDAIAVLAALVARGLPVKLVIAGEETDRGARASLIHAAAMRGVADRLLLLGFRRDVPALLASFDVLLHTAHAESFGLAILEAMAHGCPVVASSGGGVAEVVTHGRTGLLTSPGDVAALAEGVAALHADRALGERLGGAAQERVATDFTPALEAERLTLVYREVAPG